MSSARLRTPTFRDHCRFVVTHALAWGAVWIALVSAGYAEPARSASEAADAVSRGMFRKFCFDCHTRCNEEGNLALDQLLADPNKAGQHDTWVAVWKNLRLGTMPPAGEPQPEAAERSATIGWIERQVFRLDPAHPDPGRVTIRRMNRTEYGYTIHDLLGIDFIPEDVFPADDTGYGFDTIGDVLTISPLAMEKYVEAARGIVDRAVPDEGPGFPRRSVSLGGFKPATKGSKQNAYRLPFADRATLTQSLNIDLPGRYLVRCEVRALGADEATSNTAELSVSIDDGPLKSQELGWDNNTVFVLAGEAKLTKGKHKIALDLTPADPPKADEDRLYLNVRKVELEGPLDGTQREYPTEFRRVFFDGPPPADAEGRRDYAAKILRYFADRAFRRPIDEPTLERLVELADPSDDRSGHSFEQGIADGLTAILVSPRFIYRAEIQSEPNDPRKIVDLDQFALASRLSYFLWSSLPDDQLFDLARRKRLRAQLAEQVDRMLDDKRSERLVDSFVGQWLGTSDVETFAVDFRRILGIAKGESADKVFGRQLRRAMREETELLFAELLKNDESLLDLLTADYTFLNEPLAKFYGIKGVEGDKMRKVQLAPSSHRGGILTHGSFLLVTSNPTLTSPVKRGLFVLDNLLGTPPPPPPPNVPPLEASSPGGKRKLPLRQLLEQHRRDALCASCHARMDPIGLSLETYNALGQWRDSDLGKPIETAGQLITGEKFADVRELQRVIANQRRSDFYRCVTEKLLTYALGRGIEYYDAPTVDRLVSDLETSGGKLRGLVQEIVASPAFQQRRGDGPQPSATATQPKPAAKSQPKGLSENQGPLTPGPSPTRGEGSLRKGTKGTSRAESSKPR